MPGYGFDELKAEHFGRFMTSSSPGRDACLVLRFRNENQADFPFSRLFTGGQL